MGDRAKCDLPKSVSTGVEFLSAAKATWTMAECTRNLSNFLVQGKLDPSEARLPQATTLTGKFFVAMKDVRDVSGGDARDNFTATVTTMISRLEELGKALGEELIAPLKTTFFGSIFTHKFMTDRRVFSTSSWGTAVLSAPLMFVFVFVITIRIRRISCTLQTSACMIPLYATKLHLWTRSWTCSA